jgi:23S rRNA (pseudouridine1915-N3)-methyltransferase
MKITLIAIGKTDEAWIQEGINKYVDRLKHYITFNIIIIPDLKNAGKLTQEQQKVEEGKLILQKILNSDHVLLLDEKGKTFSSIDFSGHLQKKMNSGLSHLVFVIGGPFGFSEELYKRAQDKISLSSMTLSHQMIRIFFCEQLYRAFTILKGEKYHHE